MKNKIYTRSLFRRDWREATREHARKYILNKAKSLTAPPTMEKRLEILKSYVKGICPLELCGDELREIIQ